QILVHQRRLQLRIGLLPFRRHPVVPVGGEQLQPLVVAQFVEQPGLAINEVGQIVSNDGADCVHSAASAYFACLAGSCTDMVMNFTQAWNWLRICRSLVPPTTAVSSSTSPGCKSRWTLTHSKPSACRPCWARSYTSRSSWPTMEV